MSLYMKGGDPFTGHGGAKYAKEGLIEQGDYNLAHRFGWLPADAPAPEAAPEVPAKDAKKS